MLEQENRKAIINQHSRLSLNDGQNPTTRLVGKKAGKKIGRGQTVRLKVLNSDGTESAEFSYTRP